MNDSPADRATTSIEPPFDDRSGDDGPGLERLKSVVATGARNGSLAIGVGALLLLRAVRTVRRGPLRAVVQATIGVAVLRAGLRQRRSTADEPADERWSAEDVATTEGSEKKVSDEAHAARRRPDHGRETETDPEGTIEEEPAVPGDDDPSRPTPATDVEIEDSSKDPRESDEDEEDVDLSETALADEPGEATGPSAEQAQPTRTDEREQDLAAGETEPDDEEDAAGADANREDEEARERDE